MIGLNLEIDRKFKGYVTGAYNLEVNVDGIKITAKSDQGLFYGVQILVLKI